jgi:hypothetical protein
MTDETNLIRARRQGGFDEARLIGQRLPRLSRPGRGLAIAEQVDCANAKVALQVIHQAPPLAGARRARMQQHDRGTGSGFEKVNLGRCQYTHSSVLAERKSGGPYLPRWVDQIRDVCGPARSARNAVMAEATVLLTSLRPDAGAPGLFAGIVGRVHICDRERALTVDLDHGVF